ncbi:MAG: hypothetical protein J5I98_13690 [Phaeodactylibacter sp.]|nr:hypothetical protein [Phaeodactylibacter sp.]
MAFLFTACQKDGLPDPPAQSVEGAATNQSLLALRSGEEPTPTILGGPRANPYTAAVMAQAWNNLYGENYAYDSLPHTHLYVKLSPLDIEQLATLQESGLVLLDFPMDHEVLEMGDYYPQPWKAEEEIPDYFTVVASEEELPIGSYEVLEQLVVPPYDSYLTAEAFRLTGNEYLPGGVEGGGPPAPENGCHPGCTYYPDCLMGDPCEDEDPGGNPPGTDEPEPPCTPEDPLWPDCLMEPGSDEPGSGSPYTTNGCGCRVFANARKPGGCIDVEDTQLGMEGVRQVRVNWWDGWFTVKTVLTDDEGCWRIDHVEAGKAYMWVKFKGPRSSLRGFVGNTVQIWRLFVDIVDFAGQMGGGTYNNISLAYNRWANQGSAAHRYWSAATVNNGIHEFFDEAAADGINTPFLHNDKPLDVFLAGNRGDGFALMPHAMGPVRVAAAVAGGLEIGDLLFGGVNIPGWQLASLSYFLYPDMMIGCNPNPRESDELRETVYHECAHASHFGQVGPDYWLALVLAEIAAGGWGDANSLDAGRIAVCESWAEYIGDSYNHRRYGANNSVGGIDTWETLLERTRNNTPNHVPIGLHLDLVDPAVGLEPFLACEDNDGTSCGPILDNVAGFTNAQLFSVLDAATSTPEEYRIRIINDLLGIPAQVNDLFNSY